MKRNKENTKALAFQNIVKEVTSLINSIPLTSNLRDIFINQIQTFQKNGEACLVKQTDIKINQFYSAWDEFTLNFEEVTKTNFFELEQKFLEENLSCVHEVIKEMQTMVYEENRNYIQALNSEEEAFFKLEEFTEKLQKHVFQNGEIDYSKLSRIRSTFKRFKKELETTYRPIFQSGNNTDFEQITEINRCQSYINMCISSLSTSSREGLMSFDNYWTPDFHNVIFNKKYKKWNEKISQIFDRSGQIEFSNPGSECEIAMNKMKSELYNSEQYNKILTQQVERMSAEIEKASRANREMETMKDELAISNAARKRSEATLTELKAQNKFLTSKLRGEDYTSAIKIDEIIEQRDAALSRIEDLQSRLHQEQIKSQQAMLIGGVESITNRDDNKEDIYKLYQTALADNNLRRQSEEEALSKLKDYNDLKLKYKQLKYNEMELLKSNEELVAELNRMKMDDKNDLMKQLQSIAGQMSCNIKNDKEMREELEKLKMENIELTENLESVESELKESNRLLKSKISEIASLKEDFEEKKTEIADIKTTKKELAKLYEKYNKIKSERDSIKILLNETQNENIKISTTINEARDRFIKIQTSSIKGESNVDETFLLLEENKDELEKEKNKVEEQKQINQELTKEISSFKLICNNIQKEKKDLEIKLQNTKELMGKMKNNFIQNNADLEQSNIQIERLQNQINKRKEQNKQLRENIISLETKIFEKEKIIESLNTKVEIQKSTISGLKSMINDKDAVIQTNQKDIELLKRKSDHIDELSGTLNSLNKRRSEIGQLSRIYHDSKSKVIGYNGTKINRKDVPSMLQEMKESYNVQLEQFNQQTRRRVLHENAALIDENNELKAAIELLGETNNKLFKQCERVSSELVKLKARADLADSDISLEEQISKKSKEMRRLRREIDAALSSVESAAGLQVGKMSLPERIISIGNYISDRKKEMHFVETLGDIPRDGDTYLNISEVNCSGDDASNETQSFEEEDDYEK